jgi:hypothetical protein
VATLQNNLGVLLADAGRGDEAERLFAEALPVLRETLGAGHPTTEACAANLKDLHQAD